jgi:hypothetical protein
MTNTGHCPTCGNDSWLICGSCSQTATTLVCVSCGKDYTPANFTLCYSCQKPLCDDCETVYNIFSYCPECLPDKAMNCSFDNYNCSELGKYTCSLCKKKICGEHLSTCSHCENIICNDCWNYNECNKCGNIDLCDTCINNHNCARIMK